jgi:hypothetical protein
MVFKRQIALFLGCAALAFGFTLAASAGSRISFKTELVNLYPDDPSRREIGGLIFRGGVKISSSHSRFGGLSALSISKDRNHFIVISDRGTKIDGAIIYGPKGNLKNVADLIINELSGIGGKAFRTAYDGDSESVARLPNGELLISFERDHRLVAYSEDNAIPFTQPPGLDQAPKNGGIEALTNLLNGDLLTFAEGWGTETSIRGWLWRNDHWSNISLLRDGEFRPSGAATTPDGDVYVLLRKFSILSGSTIRIGRIAKDSIRANAILKTIPVVEIKSPSLVSNFEGIDIRQGRDGKNYLYLVSDDNFNPFQKTYLLMFEIKR